MKLQCLLSSSLLSASILVHFSGYTTVSAFQRSSLIQRSIHFSSQSSSHTPFLMSDTTKIRVNKQMGALQMASQVQEMKPPDKIQSKLSKTTTATSSSSSSSSSQEIVPKTMANAIRVFFLSMDGIGPLMISITLVTLLSWRLTALGPISTGDFGVFVGSIVFWSFQEHVLHDKVLHSDFDWYGKDIHQEHHDKPYFHISIDPLPLMAAWMATAHLIYRCLFPLPLAVSGTLGYAAAGLFYEWAHYIVHTKVKPRNAFMKKMRDNHIRHHCVDHRYWFAFSIPMIDDLMATNPDVQEIRRLKRKQAKSSAAPPATVH